MKRRDFLAGAAVGAALGCQSRPKPSAAEEPTPKPEPRPEPKPAEPARPANTPERGRVSYAQMGEDVVIAGIVQAIGLGTPTFIDIGAHHPVIYNNTYLLYTLGARGVLVEPNPFYCDMLRARRPGDKTLNIGIGIDDTTEADYYVIKGDGALNTFSKDQVDRYKAADGGKDAVVEVKKMPLLNINRVLKENLGKAPDIFSIDVEGLDLAILQTLDFDTFKPPILCVETLVWGTKKVETAIEEFVLSKGYDLRGRTFINSIFVDRKYLS